MVAEAIAGQRNAVSLRWRYEQRDNGFVFQQDLTDAVVSCTITLDNFRPVVRTARFVLRGDALPVGFDFAENNIAARAEVLVGGSFQSFPMGLFRLGVPTRSYRSNRHVRWEVEASDLSALVQRTSLDEPYVIAAGDNYVQSVRDILTLVGVAHNLPSDPRVTPVEFTWAPATGLLDIANSLLLAINYFPAWLSAQGVATSRQRVDPATETEAVIYSTVDEPKMIVEPFTEDEDRNRFVNQVVVLVDHPKRAPAFELRRNNDPQSPISIARTGTTMTSEIDGAIVFDLATAGDIADYDVREQAIRSFRAGIMTKFDPRRDAHEYYRLYVDGATTNQLYAVQGWSVSDRIPSPMTHRLWRAQGITVT